MAETAKRRAAGGHRVLAGGGERGGERRAGRRQGDANAELVPNPRLKEASGRLRRCRLSTVPRDLPGQPLLLGFGRRSSVINWFGLNPN